MEEVYDWLSDAEKQADSIVVNEDDIGSVMEEYGRHRVWLSTYLSVLFTSQHSVSFSLYRDRLSSILVRLEGWYFRLKFLRFVYLSVDCFFITYLVIFFEQELKEEISSFEPTFKNAIGISDRLLTERIVDPERAESYETEINTLENRWKNLQLKTMDNGAK